jgi:hypothetical protein
MKNNRLLTASLVAALALVTALFAVRLPVVTAHEGRDVGPYRLRIGWQVEPAFAGVPNGPEVFIEMKDDPSKKVTGAEATLKLEVSFGNKSKTVKLDAAWNDPGHYVADLTPTRPGDYVFKLTGKIGDTEVNETFSSANGEFSSVEPASDVLFPDENADILSLQAQIDALKAEIEALKAKQ